LLLLLLLLLGTLLVLAYADGAAWVWAALVRDLACRTAHLLAAGLPLVCSVCTSIAAWSSKTLLLLLWPARKLIPVPVAQPVPLLLATAWLGWLPAAAPFAAEVLLSARLPPRFKKSCARPTE
jgi:hypothetical protein